MNVLIEFYSVSSIFLFSSCRFFWLDFVNIPFELTILTRKDWCFAQFSTEMAG